MNRIILGTANFGVEYKGSCVSRVEAWAIMKMAQFLGINWLETAFNYGQALRYIREYEQTTGTRFRVILKADTRFEFFQAEKELGRKADLLMWHHGRPLDHNYWKAVTGASLYTRTEYRQAIMQGASVVEFPISAIDTRFAFMRRKPNVIHIARSVFAGGEAFRLDYRGVIEGARFANGLSLSEVFWNSVASNPLVDYLCVGVENPHNLLEVHSYRTYDISYTAEGMFAVPLEPPLPKVMLPHDERGN